MPGWEPCVECALWACPACLHPSGRVPSRSDDVVSVSSSSQTEWLVLLAGEASPWVVRRGVLVEGGGVARRFHAVSWSVGQPLRVLLFGVVDECGLVEEAVRWP